MKTKTEGPKDYLVIQRETGDMNSGNLSNFSFNSLKEAADFLYSNPKAIDGKPKIIVKRVGIETELGEDYSYRVKATEDTESKGQFYKLTHESYCRAQVVKLNGLSDLLLNEIGLPNDSTSFVARGIELKLSEE